MWKPRVILRVVHAISSVHFGRVARAPARRGMMSLESETGRV